MIKSELLVGVEGLRHARLTVIALLLIYRLLKHWLLPKLRLRSAKDGLRLLCVKWILRNRTRLGLERGAG